MFFKRISKKSKTLLLVFFVGMLIAGGIALAQSPLDSIVPNQEAGWSTAKIFMTVFGSVLLMAAAAYLSQTAKGLAMGFVVKSWNVIAPQVSSLRFGTATGFYDSPITKIGPFAVWCQLEKDGEVIIDRVPHGKLVNDRFTITNARQPISKA